MDCTSGSSSWFAPGSSVYDNVDATQSSDPPGARVLQEVITVTATQFFFPLAVEGVPSDAELACRDLTYDADNVNNPFPFDYEVKTV